MQIAYIISRTHKSLGFEWTVQGLRQQGITPIFVLLNPTTQTPFQQFLEEAGFEVYFIRLRGKQDYPWAFAQLVKYLKNRKIDIVHTHFLKANLIGLTAAKLAGIPVRIYTRHHSTFHWEYFPKGIWYDRLSNRLATDIVAISQNVYNILRQREGVADNKLHLIHHGFSWQTLESCTAERIHRLKQQYSIPLQARPIVGIIARYIHCKGIQFAIPAFACFRQHYPQAHLVLANARGGYTSTIQQLLQKHLPEGSYTQIPFEEDVAALYGLFDLYVHVPINPHIEAFGQTYVEALACGVPSIFTLSGVAAEFIRHGENAWVVPFQDSQAISYALQALWQEENLRQRLAAAGKASVKERFDLARMLNKLVQLYKNGYSRKRKNS